MFPSTLLLDYVYAGSPVDMQNFQWPFFIIAGIVIGKLLSRVLSFHTFKQQLTLSLAVSILGYLIAMIVFYIKSPVYFDDLILSELIEYNPKAAVWRSSLKWQHRFALFTNSFVLQYFLLFSMIGASWFYSVRNKLSMQEKAKEEANKDVPLN
jgi:hypothetical protein